MQKIRFPMEHLRVTQGRNIGSHLGTKAIDFGGKDTGADKLFAPCDMRVVRTRANANGEMYCESIEKVLFADGTEDYVNFTFIHDNAFNVPVGTVLKQGDYFYDEGGMGSGKPNAFAIHVHMEAGRGKFGTSNPIQTQTAKGTWHSNYNPKNLEDVFWLGPDVNVLNSGGYNWKVDVKETPPETPEETPEETPPETPEVIELKHKINLLEVELKTATEQKAELENIIKKQMEEIAELKSKLETNREMSWIQSIINMLFGGK